MPRSTRCVRARVVCACTRVWISLKLNSICNVQFSIWHLSTSAQYCRENVLYTSAKWLQSIKCKAIWLIQSSFVAICSCSVLILLILHSACVREFSLNHIAIEIRIIQFKLFFFPSENPCHRFIVFVTAGNMPWFGQYVFPGIREEKNQWFSGNNHLASVKQHRE